MPYAVGGEISLFAVFVQIVLDHCVERTSRDDNEPSLTVRTAVFFIFFFLRATALSVAALFS